MTFIENKKTTADTKNENKDPKKCLSRDRSKCNHEAFRGSDCPQDTDCLLWRKK